MQILVCTAWGWTNLQISEDLGISEYTVKTYVKRVFVKVGVSNRASLVRVAYDTGLIKPAGLPMPSEKRSLDYLGERLESLHDNLGRMLSRVMWLEDFRGRAPHEVPKALETLRLQVQDARAQIKELRERARAR